MLTVLLSLAAATGYGTADFLAGLAGRRASVIQVTVTVYLAGLVTVAASLLWLHASDPTPRSLWWGAIGGCGQAADALALIAGFRRAPFSIAGPVSALAGAGLAAGAGIVLGDRPGVPACAGLVLALPAILVLSAPGQRSGASARGFAFGLASGVGCAVSLFSLSRAGVSPSLWSILVMQAAGLAAVSMVALLTGEMRLPGPGARGLGAASGLLGACSATCYLFAVHAGLLAVAAVLTSMFPVTTVLLAVAVTQEQLSRMRLTGLVLAALAVALIAVGSAA
jgi:drug/metabolite transporter (DMT)-like permease